MAILAVLSIVISISALFIAMGSMRDSNQITEQTEEISKVILDKVIKMIDEEINSTNKKIKKRTKKVEKND
jgi:hypothetical protein